MKKYKKTEQKEECPLRKGPMVTLNKIILLTSYHYREGWQIFLIKCPQDLLAMLR